MARLSGDVMSVSFFAILPQRRDSPPWLIGGAAGARLYGIQTEAIRNPDADPPIASAN